MAKPGIPPDLEGVVLGKAGEGYSTRKISAWLERNHETKVSYSTVANFLRDHRKERSEQTKAVVREHISATLPNDLQRLDELNARLEVLRLSALTTDDELKIIERQFKGIDLKLKYSGADEQESHFTFEWVDADSD